MQSGHDIEKQFVYAEPEILARKDVRRIGVVIPEGSEMTPDKLKATAEDLARQDSCVVIIEYRWEENGRAN